MSVYESQFPEVVRALEAGHFEKAGKEFLRAPVDSPRERAGAKRLEQQVVDLLDRPAPRFYENDDPHDYSLTSFGTWFLDEVFELHWAERYS